MTPNQAELAQMIDTAVDKYVRTFDPSAIIMPIAKAIKDAYVQGCRDGAIMALDVVQKRFSETKSQTPTRETKP